MNASRKFFISKWAFRPIDSVIVVGLETIYNCIEHNLYKLKENLFSAFVSNGHISCLHINVDPNTILYFILQLCNNVCLVKYTCLLAVFCG